MNFPASELIKMPEGKTLEFKRDLSYPKNILKTLVAFANIAGGRLLIGVEEIGTKVRVTVFLAERISIEYTGTGGKETKTHDAEHVTEHVTEHVRRLILCLKKNTLGRQDVIQCLGLSHRPTFLYDYLKPAIQADLVEMTQPDSPKSPTQKYRMTETGRAVLFREHKGVDA